MIEELNNQGYTILRGVVDDTWINYLRVFADKALSGKEEGFAAHAIVDVPEFSHYLGHLKGIGLLDRIRDNYFNSPFIINSFSVISNRPDKPNFSSNVHRDIRFYSGDCDLMLNTLLFLDDFTIENGGTRVYPKSHLKAEPELEESVQLTGKAGDMAVWNSNLYHCSMPNTTDKDRRAIVTVYQKSALKQLIDYPEILKDRNLTDDVKQLLGFDSRVPKSMAEWYGERTYKKGQD